MYPKRKNSEKWGAPKLEGTFMRNFVLAAVAAAILMVPAAASAQSPIISDQSRRNQ